MRSEYRKVASSNTSHLEAHVSIYRLLMYCQGPFDKKFIFELVTCVNNFWSTPSPYKTTSFLDVPKPTGQPESQERSRILIQIQFVFPLSLVHNLPYFY